MNHWWLALKITGFFVLQSFGYECVISVKWNVSALMWSSTTEFPSSSTDLPWIKVEGEVHPRSISFEFYATDRWDNLPSHELALCEQVLFILSPEHGQPGGAVVEWKVCPDRIRQTLLQVQSRAWRTTERPSENNSEVDIMFWTTNL